MMKITTNKKHSKLLYCLCALLFIAMALFMTEFPAGQSFAEAETGNPSERQTETAAPQPVETPKPTENVPLPTNFISAQPTSSPSPTSFISEQPTSSAKPTNSPRPTNKPVNSLPGVSSVTEEQPFQEGNILVAAQLRTVKAQTEKRILELGASVGVYRQALPAGWENWFSQVLALFAVQNDCAANFPYEVYITGKASPAELISLYWDLTRISAEEIDGRPELNFECRDIFWEAQQRGFTQQQTEQLQNLINEKTIEKIKKLPQDSVLSILSDEELVSIVNLIPANISARRQAVLLAALSLENRIPYFWGGKSRVNGWDNRWGDIFAMRKPGEAGEKVARSFGMDCSGYVTWCFINASSNQKIGETVGNGTSNLWDKSKAVEWEALQPGDFVFKKAPGDGGINHVGFVVAKNEDGKWLVAQCGYKGRGVVLVVMESGEFKYSRSSVWYKD